MKVDVGPMTDIELLELLQEIATEIELRLMQKAGELEDGLKWPVSDAPSANGTYTLRVTVSNGVAAYSWG